jgi:hypothetical protein
VTGINNKIVASISLTACGTGIESPFDVNASLIRPFQRPERFTCSALESRFLAGGLSASIQLDPFDRPRADDHDVYLVLDDFGSRLGRAWRETDETDTDPAS